MSRTLACCLLLLLCCPHARGQQDAQEQRALHGAPPLPLHMTAVPLQAATQLLAEKSGYAIELVGLDPRRPVTLKREAGPLLGHLLALCRAARADFEIAPGGALRLIQGPRPHHPRWLDGPFLAELLWVERGRRQRFRGESEPFARAAVRLIWEPALRVVACVGPDGRMAALDGARQVVRRLTLSAPGDRAATVRCSFQLELAPALQTTSAPVGKGLAFSGSGGDPAIQLSLQSLSIAAGGLSISFGLRGLADPGRDRAVAFGLLGAGQEVAPASIERGGGPGERRYKLVFEYGKGFAPSKLVLRYPARVVRRKLDVVFSDVRLP